MKLQTKQLKQFFALSSGITTNSIIPILSYIKLEQSALTKTNLRTYVVHKIDAPAEESLLLDEKVLSGFLRDCKSEEIEIVAEKNFIRLIDGKRKMHFQTAKISEFPKLPDAEKDNLVEFDADTLSAIGVAAKNTGNIGEGHFLNYVNIFNGYVVGSDSAKFYCHKAKDGIPNMVIDLECANTISQFQDAVYYHRGRYNFFEIGNTLYGFIGVEAKTPDLSKFILKERPTDYVDIKAADFIGFCDTFMATSGAKELAATMKGNVLSFYDSEKDIDYKCEIETEGTFVAEANFLPRIWGNYFKSLGISTIRLAHAGLGNEALSVWDIDDQFFSGIVIGTKE